MRTGFYKGRKYRVDYIGNTKFGYRAKLSFFNGASTFWVPGNMVSGIKNGRSAPAPRPAPVAVADIPPPYEDEFDTYAAEAAAEQRNARMIDSGYDAYAREEGHYDTVPF